MAKQAHQRYKRVARDAPPNPPLAPTKAAIKAPAPAVVDFDAILDRTEEQTYHRDVQFEPIELPPELEPGDQPIPADWVKGQLLNVRCYGGDYRVTLLGEEYDDRHPERCLLFTNSFECQQFVSRWYAREPGGRPW